MNTRNEVNQITLLKSGQEYFPAIINAIQQATHNIYLLTYIFALDSIGLKVGESLAQAAMRGVKVYVLLDGYGCKDLPVSYRQSLEQTGINVVLFKPNISPWTFERSRLRRMHRKMVVVDSKFGFVGGINIIDDYNINTSQIPPRLDYAIRVEGPLVLEMQRSAMHFFKRNFFIKKFIRHSADKLTTFNHAPVPKAKAVLLVRDNFRHRREIENAYLIGIFQAKKEIIIANAYFLPGLRFRRALRHAARRGVKVTLLLQSKVEFVLLDLASHALYQSLLANGIQIYEYHASAMHSKVAVIDDVWAMVGSSNIDPFSLLLSHEANVLIQDEVFNNALKTDLKKTILEGARSVTIEDWSHRSLFKRFVSWLVYGLVRLLIGFSGYSK